MTAKLDRIMERLETLSLIENRLNSMASTMANIESTLSRLDADVTMLKEGARKGEKRITDLETSINYNEDDVAELQKNLYDHRAQLDKCKKDLLYLEAYSRRENVKMALEFLKPPAMKMLQSPKTPKKSYTTSSNKN